MRLRISFNEYAGVAVRVLASAGGEPKIYLTLDHRDEGLSVLLGVFDDGIETAIAARQWSRFTGRPVLIADGEGRLRTPLMATKRDGVSPRRRRRSALRNRRSTMRLRFERASRFAQKKRHLGEREIIARN